MSWEAASILKQQVPLQRYLESQHWKPVRRMAGGRLLGLCPLHHDRKPSFLVDPAKNLFYFYGCNGVKFSQAMALLRASFAGGSLLKEVANFYRIQLHRRPEAVSYLCSSGRRCRNHHSFRSGTPPAIGPSERCCAPCTACEPERIYPLGPSPCTPHP